MANRPNQNMRNVRSGGRVRQSSNVAADQRMNRINAVGDVEQLISVVGSENEAITAELTKLHEELQKYDANATVEIQRVKNAEEAAKRGDSATVVASLKGVARWVIDFAREVGTELVAKIIEKQMGL
jgi:hypothetical protein